MENDALIGQQIGAYTVQSKLGEGGMAVVYKAYHARLRREVAIKLILAQIAQQPDFRARFEREAQLVASLQHPNIVAVYDFGDFGSQSYLVMQYVGGGTLRDRLRGGHALDPRQAAQYAVQMGRALHHAHMRGIVHRDVKPQNMLISSNDPNQLLLSDFGIAKLYDNRHEPTLVNMTGNTLQDPSLTSVDQIVGTAEYMAPEQIKGEPVDTRTDVYALGVVLFQMLTGEAPFQSTTVNGLLFQHVHTPPRPIREINPYVSDALAYIVARALAKAPTARFQSAEEMAQTLEAANVNATYRLAPSQPLAPTSYGAPPQGDAPTSPSLNRQSLYGQPSQVNAPAVASSYGPQPTFTNTPPYGSAAPVTHPSGMGMLTPPLRRPARRQQPISYIITAVVLLLALVLILVRTGVLPIFNSNSNPSSNIAQPFTENFQTNDRNWTNGTINHLTASVNGQYTLQISNAPGTGETDFPHPQIGTLPDKFTFTVTMEQTRGDGSYGLAFHESEDTNGGVSCYALIIYAATGSFQVLKYNPSLPDHYTILGSATSPAIKAGYYKFNKLQVIVDGSKFSFSINDQPLSGITPDSAYSGGQLAVLASGTNASFVVQQVTLATSLGIC